MYQAMQGYDSMPRLVPGADNVSVLYDTLVVFDPSVTTTLVSRVGLSCPSNPGFFRSFDKGILCGRA